MSTNLEKRKNKAVYKSYDIVKAFGKSSFVGGGLMELSSSVACSYFIINHCK